MQRQTGYVRASGFSRRSSNNRAGLGCFTVVVGFIAVVVIIGLIRAPEQRQWTTAHTADTIAALQQYVATYPTGNHAAEANARIDALRHNDATFERAVRAGTREAYEDFLRLNPGHQRESELRAALAANDVGPQDVVDLVQQGKIRLQAKGDGIQRVNVELRRVVNYPLRVDIPAGALFIPRQSYSQTMIATAQTTVDLLQSDSKTINVPVACTNWSKNVPYGSDTMRVVRASNPNLVLVGPLLGRVQSYPVQQAIVWIMSDNTDYAALGKLCQNCFFGTPGIRVIGPDEAAEAMKILVDAGVELRRWAIWRDRGQILRRVRREDLKAWLQAQR